MSASDGSKGDDIRRRERKAMAGAMLAIIRALFMLRQENSNTRRVLLDMLAGDNSEAWNKLKEIFDKEEKNVDHMDEALSSLKHLIEVLQEASDG